MTCRGATAILRPFKYQVDGREMEGAAGEVEIVGQTKSVVGTLSWTARQSRRHLGSSIIVCQVVVALLSLLVCVCVFLREATAVPLYGHLEGGKPCVARPPIIGRMVHARFVRRRYLRRCAIFLKLKKMASQFLRTKEPRRRGDC